MNKLKSGRELTQEYRILQLLSCFNGPILFESLEIIQGLKINVFKKMADEGFILIADGLIEITDHGRKERQNLHEQFFEY